MTDADRKAIALLALLGYIFGLGACATIQHKRESALRPAAALETGAAPADLLLLVASCP